MRNVRVRNDTKGAATRRRVLDVAARLIADRRTAEISLAEVARAADLKAGSLYFHFASRDELVAEVLAVGIEESIEQLELSLASVDNDAGGRLLAAIRAHVGARVDLSDYAWAVLSIGDHLGTLRAERFVKRRRHYARIWYELIGHAQRTGVLPVGVDPRLIRAILFAAMNIETRDTVWSAEDVVEALSTLLGAKSS